MNLKRGLYALLTGEATISAIVVTSVHPVTLPERADLPAIRYQIVGGNSSPTLTTSGMQRWRVQFDCIGTTHDSADALRTALIEFLNGYTGVLADGTALQNADFVQALDLFDDDPRQYRCVAEFYLYFVLS